MSGTFCVLRESFDVWGNGWYMLSGRISESVPVRQLADTELRNDPEVSGRSWRTTDPRPAICTVLQAVV
ncbi:hypothetical protein [uncultured Draconibacterium sp.]|uniref:hypothetical protein n=1 Tax=uncultured Draconibacterium sp. TaxID=1573823 RepID=UPI002AA5F262|nr:hypothetical protein [uncultured Draconibacterium sp.]